MKEFEFYRGFDPLPEVDEIVDTLVNDPPEVRWKVVRSLFRIKDPADRRELTAKLQARESEVGDDRVKGRIGMALQALSSPFRMDDYVVVKGKGAFAPAELEPSVEPHFSPEFPIVDFHMYPKLPDLKFMYDMKQAGITRGVILTSDTDPSDLDRPEVVDQIRKGYSKTRLTRFVPFQKVLQEIRSTLYSPTAVTNRDVADWVQDYPEILTGLGSVNLSKDTDYVERKLDEIARLKLRGVKLCPHSQFFNPSENDNAYLLFEYCRATGSIVLSHSGCGAGPFELPQLSSNSHPGLWEPLVRDYPDVTLVLAHFGSYSPSAPGIWLYDALQLGEKYGNVYADLAAVHTLLDVEEVVQEIRATIGFDRVLFASDYPLPIYQDQTLRDVVMNVTLNPKLSGEEKWAILGGNAAKLLGTGAISPSKK